MVQGPEMCKISRESLGGGVGIGCLGDEEESVSHGGVAGFGSGYDGEESGCADDGCSVWL